MVSNPLLYSDFRGLLIVTRGPGGRPETTPGWQAFCWVSDAYQLELKARRDESVANANTAYNNAQAGAKWQQQKDFKLCTDELEACNKRTCPPPNAGECDKKFWDCVARANKSYDDRYQYNFENFTNELTRLENLYQNFGGGYSCPDI